MKNSRRFISAVMALSMLSAIAPMSAFAADADRITIDQNSTEKKGTMTATYDVQAKYTVTIPAGVTLDSTNAVSKNIEASDVVLESGQKITVKLTGASNTAEGSSFSAKNDKGDSTATYTIGKGEATSGIAVGDFVAEFKSEGTQALTFSKAEGATYAGTHTETLTFGIEVEKASNNPYAANNVGDTVTFGSYDWYIIGKSDNGVTLLMKENLTTKGYNDSYASVTWETCSLRTYLNGEFYNGSGFSDDDRAKIVKTSITNPNNPGYGTNGGNATEDYIYLLSIAEANALDSSIRNIGSSWWLRSPGSDSHFAAFVNGGGDVLTNGGNLSLNRGVRPVVNLKF